MLITVPRTYCYERIGKQRTQIQDMRKPRELWFFWMDGHAFWFLSRPYYYPIQNGSSAFCKKLLLLTISSNHNVRAIMIVAVNHLLNVANVTWRRWKRPLAKRVLTKEEHFGHVRTRNTRDVSFLNGATESLNRLSPKLLVRIEHGLGTNVSRYML